jgi:hypothetical protein
MKGKWAFWLPLLAFTLNSGCSYLFVQGPARTGMIDCTEEYLWPEVDYTLAALEGGRVVYDAQQASRAFAGAPVSRGADMVLNGTLAIVFVSSAILGTMKVHECREAIEEASRPDWQTELKERSKTLERRRERQKSIPAGDTLADPSGTTPAIEKPGGPPATPQVFPDHDN